MQQQYSVREYSSEVIEKLRTKFVSRDINPNTTAVEEYTTVADTLAVTLVVFFCFQKERFPVLLHLGLEDLLAAAKDFASIEEGGYTLSTCVSRVNS